MVSLLQLSPEHHPPNHCYCFLSGGINSIHHGFGKLIFCRHMSYFDEEFESRALPVIIRGATVASANLMMERSFAWSLSYYALRSAISWADYVAQVLKTVAFGRCQYFC